MDAPPIPSKEAIRRIALEVLEGGVEKPKIELKWQKGDQELAKVISAIANTAGDERNNPLFRFPELGDDYGMLILGVDDETGKIVGLPDDGPGWMRGSKPDAVGAQLKQKLEKWIEPVPHLDVYVFDEEVGRWIVVLIHPSNYLPHAFKRNADGVTAGEWFARHDTRTELANPADHQRLRERISQAAGERIRAVEGRLQRKIEDLEGRLSELEKTPRAPSPAPDATESPEARAGSGGYSARAAPSVALHRHLAKPLDPVEREADRAFDGWMEALEGIELPWDYVPKKQEELARTVRSLEEASYEVVRSLGVLVAGDDGGKYTPLVRERLEEFALKHGRTPVNVTYNYGAMALHAYPGVLVENALAVVAHAHENAHYLGMLKGLRIRDHNERPLPWVPALRDRAVHASDWIKEAFSARWCDPLSERARILLLEEPGLVRDVLPRWVRNPERLFTQAELILSMIALENTKGEPRAYFGRYVYIFGGVSKDACAMLERDHAHLDRLFNRPLGEALRGLWHYFLLLKGALPCPNMMARSWPDCLKKPNEE